MCLAAASAALALAVVLVLAVITTRPAQAQTFTTLFSFDYTNGENPYAGLVQATDGNLYGTTHYGGTNGQSDVFKISTGGALTTLYSFCSQSNCTDGSNPYAGLVQATAEGAARASVDQPGNYCCSKIDTVPSVKFATARSSFPSPLKSAAAIWYGPCPTA
jgi:uncharacterized repeat protein (TIGR03803 family)